MYPLRTNRSIIAYIVLTIVTCGIYSIWFLWQMSNDMNRLCQGDGKHTPGLLSFILLSLVTCGFYSLFWYYSVCERVAAYLVRNNKPVPVDGTKWLLWSIVGSLICGLGSLYANYLLFNALNLASADYNSKLSFGNPTMQE